ncbi:hypothetical protein FO519_004600 [Halicephalobus sp. NKZ332]|nr:hypothetical protein FO519_004600 [Halicephalobus sp. NKZ332]
MFDDPGRNFPGTLPNATSTVDIKKSPDSIGDMTMAADRLQYYENLRRRESQTAANGDSNTAEEQDYRYGADIRDDNLKGPDNWYFRNHDDRDFPSCFVKPVFGGHMVRGYQESDQSGPNYQLSRVPKQLGPNYQLPQKAKQSDPKYQLPKPKYPYSSLERPKKIGDQVLIFPPPKPTERRDYIQDERSKKVSGPVPLLPFVRSFHVGEEPRYERPKTVNNMPFNRSWHGHSERPRNCNNLMPLLPPPELHHNCNMGLYERQRKTDEESSNRSWQSHSERPKKISDQLLVFPSPKRESSKNEKHRSKKPKKVSDQLLVYSSSESEVEDEGCCAHCSHCQRASGKSKKEWSPEYDHDRSLGDNGPKNFYSFANGPPGFRINDNFHCELNQPNTSAPKPKKPNKARKAASRGITKKAQFLFM